MKQVQILGTGCPKCKKLAENAEAAAKALGIDDRAGALRPGAPAELTVCRIVKGKYEFADTEGKMRTADEKIFPVSAFMGGKWYPSDLDRCQNEDNWLLQIAEDHVPDCAHDLTARQLAFLELLAQELSSTNWHYDLEHLDLAKAHELRALCDGAVQRSGIGLREALLAVFACFLDRPFTMQIGLFLLHLERGFLLARLHDVVSSAKVAE